MKVLIVEDEQPAFGNLVDELQAIDGNIDVVAGCSSVEESIRWLNDNPGFNPRVHIGVYTLV